MTTIMPRKKALRDAVQWISDQRRERPDAKLFELIAEAGQRFDLTPVDQEALLVTLKEEERALGQQSQAPEGE